MPFSLSISGVRASADPPDRNASNSSEATPSARLHDHEARLDRQLGDQAASTSGLKSLWEERTFEPAWADDVPRFTGREADVDWVSHRAGFEDAVNKPRAAGRVDRSGTKPIAGARSPSAPGRWRADASARRTAGSEALVPRRRLRPSRRSRSRAIAELEHRKGTNTGRPPQPIRCGASLAPPIGRRREPPRDRGTRYLSGAVMRRLRAGRPLSPRTVRPGAECGAAKPAPSGRTRPCGAPAAEKPRLRL